MISRFRPYIYLLIVLITGACTHAAAQCPVNIGFETGTFANWTCDSSTVFSQKQFFTKPGAPPVANRHTMIQDDPFHRKDPYGGFPVACPNGGNYSIKL